MNRGVWVSGIVAIAAILTLATPARALPPLSAATVAELLLTVPGWVTDGQRLTCTYEFRDFLTTMAVVNHFVAPAEAIGHHPDLAIAYNRVTISLTTHDAGGLTPLDFALAADLSALVATLQPAAAACQP